MDPRTQRRARRNDLARLAAEREQAGRNAPALVRFRRWRRAVGALVLQLLAPAVLRLVAATWRVERSGSPGFDLLRSAAPWIVVMWHGRMLALMPLAHHCRRNIGVLVSPSDDGGLATRALARFGYRVVRGSLSRGGARAMRAMRAWLDDGAQLVITPDGPRGPRHSVNVGAVWLARATGVPLLPVAVAVDHATRLSTWDRFTIPRPFARLRVVYGNPIHVAADTGDDALERIALELRTGLLAAERNAFAELGVADDLDDGSPPPPGAATAADHPSQ